MSRIEKCLQICKDEGRAALIPYVTAGDPYPELTVDLMHALVEAGSDIIELGIPFSDPMADGPVIQKAVENALAHDVSLKDVLSMVRRFREKDQETAIVLMGYLNPVEKMGYEAFAKACSEVGVDAVLTVDMPPEESSDLLKQLNAVDIDNIFLMAPTTRHDRIKLIAESASGYIYYVSLKGITGADKLDLDSVKERMTEIRSITNLPIAVGFGIKTAEMAASVAKISDGVVVGSAIVTLIHQCAKELAIPQGVRPQALNEANRTIIDAVKTFVMPFREAVNVARLS